jgi:hypothetical protein
MNLDGYRDLYIQSRCLLFPIFAELDVRHMNLQECDGRHQRQNMNLRCSSCQVAGRIMLEVSFLLGGLGYYCLPYSFVSKMPPSRVYASIDVSPFSIFLHSLTVPYLLRRFLNIRRHLLHVVILCYSTNHEVQPQSLSSHPNVIALWLILI